LNGRCESGKAQIDVQIATDIDRPLNGDEAIKLRDDLVFPGSWRLQMEGAVLSRLGFRTGLEPDRRSSDQLSGRVPVMTAATADDARKRMVRRERIIRSSQPDSNAAR
jgi:hypothetical protein